MGAVTNLSGRALLGVCVFALGLIAPVIAAAQSPRVPPPPPARAGDQGPVQSVAVPRAPAPETQPARAPVAPGQEIRAIRVDGTLRIDPETVLSYLAVRVGEGFDGATVDQSLKALFATGLFADVVMARDGSTLVVRVVENPIINRVAFEGNRRIEDDVLSRETQLKPRSVYTRTRVQGDVRRILEIYRRSGRFAAQVEPKLIQLPQNRVDIVYEITEGPRTGIGRINFLGNKQFSDRRLREVIQTTESAWYKFLATNDAYDPDRLAFDREQLRRHYLRNGYVDFRVQSAIAELNPERDAFLLSFTVEEGERYRVGAVDLRSSIREIDPTTLKALIQTREGDWYSSDLMEATIRSISQALGNLGYAFVEVEPVVDRNRENRTIGLTYEIREGPKVFVERIEITGNVRTLDKVVRREMRLSEGDAFNTARLRRSEQQLRNLQFFSKVEVQTQPGSQPDRTVINVQVEETGTGEVTFGAGFSTSDGPLGTVGVRERNLLGRGQELSVSALISGNRNQFDISFTEPYFLDRNVAAGIDLFRIERDLRDQSSYDYRTTGFRPRLGYQITDRWRQALSYTLRQDEVTNIQSGASRFVRESAGTRVTSAIGTDFTYDALDSRIDPTDGYLFSVGGDVAGLGGDARYLRLRSRAAWYYPVAEDYVFSVRTDIGFIRSLSGGSVALNDRYFVGGDQFRGFRSGGAGARDRATRDALGNESFILGTLEQTVPVPLLPRDFGITGRFFAEGGLTYGLSDSDPLVLQSDSFRASIGFGLSWRSPFGLLRLDFPVPVLKESFDRTENFRIGFGTRF
ncbi:MAG: outer membrane protein assembly factor BamA [Alphaproteobacteria bacterium]|nr:outer membrane protein assembly factor BamA [Alphaproteobacteria bacterium]TAD92018.1 MAG: outer membrane protein assembly factor BamA [Alphaproteobacteria bacterium]